MIGVYDYTVILTYLSLISGVLGVFFSINGTEPFVSAVCLMVCGLCDTFDGKVARTKKNRTEQERAFGVQIDSLVDVIAFGVLPASIGFAVLNRSGRLAAADNFWRNTMYLVPALYVLAAVIRLAWFNVTAEEHKEGETVIYTGLPVTVSSVLFPAVIILNYLIEADLSAVYLTLLLVVGAMFISRFHFKKPRLRTIIFVIVLSLIEILVLLVTTGVLK